MKMLIAVQDKNTLLCYLSQNSTVNLCALDMSKAFDKLNHYALFIKLMDRNVPLVVLNVLVYWYAMCAAVVRRDSMFSSVVQLQCGVRQGGVLSPVLFALYVDVCYVCLQCFDAVGLAAGRAPGL